MKQHEAVMKAMEANGGYATLAHLYREVLKITGVRWGTKTPFASIRRIVQDPRFFFRIRPGLWALNDWKDRLPFAARELAPRKEDAFTHSFYQGLVVEIGNMKRFGTFVPNQDKNKKYLTTPLADLRTMSELHPFSYKRFLDCASTIDVAWFNDRKMPHSFFEIEHTTDMLSALVKFVELQDFSSRFVIVADRNRRAEFTDRLSREAFRPVASRVTFWDYENLSNAHSRAYQSALLGV